MGTHASITHIGPKVAFIPSFIKSCHFFCLWIVSREDRMKNIPPFNTIPVNMLFLLRVRIFSNSSNKLFISPPWQIQTLGFLNKSAPPQKCHMGQVDTDSSRQNVSVCNPRLEIIAKVCHIIQHIYTISQIPLSRILMDTYSLTQGPHYLSRDGQIKCVSSIKSISRAVILTWSAIVLVIPK